MRLDSGDLVAEAFKVRAQLDALGATSTRITVTNDLDEHAIAALGAAPVAQWLSSCAPLWRPRVSPVQILGTEVAPLVELC